MSETSEAVDKTVRGMAAVLVALFDAGDSLMHGNPAEDFPDRAKLEALHEALYSLEATKYVAVSRVLTSTDRP